MPKKSALEKLRSAAALGDVEAQVKLGRVYFMAKDYTEAMKWHRIAAAHGHPEARYNIGTAHIFGRGVPRDIPEASKWLQKLEEGIDKPGQYNPPTIAQEEVKTPEDEIELCKWICKSAGLPDPFDAPDESLLHLVRLYLYDEPTPIVDMNLLESYRKAAEQDDKAAKQDDTDPRNILWFMFDEGQESPWKIRQIPKWLRKAAEEGDPEAQCCLGVLLFKGGGSPQNRSEALRWLQMAADQGLPAAVEALRALKSVLPQLKKK